MRVFQGCLPLPYSMGREVPRRGVGGTGKKIGGVRPRDRSCHLLLSGDTGADTPESRRQHHAEEREEYGVKVQVGFEASLG